MSLEQTAQNPVHFPANPNKFAFDAPVAAIFENMADRSIPNFRASHAAHAAMLHDWITQPAGASILDVGSSRGAFLAAIRAMYPENWPGLSIQAVDNSPAMCEYLSQDFPDILVHCEDIAGDEFQSRKRQYDVVCVHYVLQFISIPDQWKVLLHLFSLVRPGGVLVFGHKSEHHGRSGELAHEEYIKFRIGNGYTREEIEAKTLALRGSMFPMNHEAVLAAVKRNFSDVSETFRFMMFSALFAIK